MTPGRETIHRNPAVQAAAPHRPVQSSSEGRNENAACMRKRKKYMNVA
jgi:hypothetical protein